MNEFDHRSQRYMLLTVDFAGFCGKKNEEGTQALAASLNDIVANIFNKRHIRVELVYNEFINGLKVVFDNGSNLLIHSHF